jgi:hypothetical protein
VIIRLLKLSKSLQIEFVTHVAQEQVKDGLTWNRGISGIPGGSLKTNTSTEQENLEPNKTGQVRIWHFRVTIVAVEK